MDQCALWPWLAGATTSTDLVEIEVPWNAISPAATGLKPIKISWLWITSDHVSSGRHSQPTNISWLCCNCIFFSLWSSLCLCSHTPPACNIKNHRIQIYECHPPRFWVSSQGSKPWYQSEWPGPHNIDFNSNFRIPCPGPHFSAYWLCQRDHGSCRCPWDKWWILARNWYPWGRRTLSSFLFCQSHI